MSLMQIPRKIEYALRAMIYLADRPDAVERGAEIARHEQIPKYYLEKVIRDLMRRGLVHARRGPGGGYQLARAAATISFRDIIEAVEGPITLNVCTDGSSSCALQPTCRMFRVWEKGQQILLEMFSDTTLGEIARSTPPGAPFLAAAGELPLAVPEKH
ncbi:MAG: RrF2 family transcriptional regulator [Candidatus Binataceae bacterium]